MARGRRSRAGPALEEEPSDTGSSVLATIPASDPALDGLADSAGGGGT